MDRKRFSFEGLARPAMTIFAAAVLGGFLNYLFQSYMGRTLGPDEYSQLASLLSIFYILIIPSTLIGTTVLFYVSRLKAQEKDGEIAWLMRRNLRLCLLVGVVMGLAMLLLSPFLLEFLNIDQPVLAAMLAAGAFLLMLGTPVYSTTQALQRFNRLAVYEVLNPLLKLAFGLLLVGIIGWSMAAGAFAGVLIGTVLAFLWLYLGLKDYWTKERKPFATKGMAAYTVPVAISTISFMLITNIDNLLARGFLDPTEAGLYSACSMLGKIVLWMPLAITTVTFPRFSGAGVKGQSTRSLIHKSILITVAISGAITLFCFLFPDFVLRLTFGDEFLDAADILPVVILAFSLFGLATMFQRYGLATGKWVFIIIYATFTIVGIGLILLFHDTPMQIALGMLATSAGISIVSLVYLELKLKEEGAASSKDRKEG
jgi:O-antigen/teichoic acid export membrane protein